MRAWRLRALRTGPPRLCLVARTRPDSHVAPAPRAGTATCASVCGHAAGERRARPLLTPPPPAADARGAAAGAASAPGDRAGGTRCSGRASTSIRPPRSDSDVAGQRGATRTSPRGQSGGRSLLRLRRVRDRGRRGATRMLGGRRGAQDWPPTKPTRTAVWLRRAQTRRRAANSPRGRCSGRMQPRGRSTENGARGADDRRRRSRSEPERVPADSDGRRGTRRVSTDPTSEQGLHRGPGIGRPRTGRAVSPFSMAPFEHPAVLRTGSTRCTTQRSIRAPSIDLAASGL